MVEWHGTDRPEPEEADRCTPVWDETGESSGQGEWNVGWTLIAHHSARHQEMVDGARDLGFAECMAAELNDRRGSWWSLDEAEESIDFV